MKGALMNIIDFQQIIEIPNETDAIKIGYIKGSEKVLFIKTGQGGSIYGYDNKYLYLAQSINEKYGSTVFVSATTSDSKALYDEEMRIVANCLQDMSYEIYYLGISKGGLIGCWYGAENTKIKRIVAVNAPLMINLHNRTLPSIKKLPCNKLTMVYGSLDPSYHYIDFVKPYITVKTVIGADHQFRNHTEMFETIAIDLLENKKTKVSYQATKLPFESAILKGTKVKGGFYYEKQHYRTRIYP